MARKTVKFETATMLAIGGTEHANVGLILVGSNNVGLAGKVDDVEFGTEFFDLAAILSMQQRSKIEKINTGGIKLESIEKSFAFRVDFQGDDLLRFVVLREESVVVAVAVQRWLLEFVRDERQGSPAKSATAGRAGRTLGN